VKGAAYKSLKFSLFKIRKINFLRVSMITAKALIKKKRETNGKRCINFFKIIFEFTLCKGITLKTNV
jgi:hypothetical protein